MTMPSSKRDHAITKIQRLIVETGERQQMIDISDRVSSAIRGWQDRAIAIYVQHTTAGIVINANADEDVANDILVALNHIVPEGGLYRHSAGNSPAHVKATLVGTSQLVPLADGEMALGTFQSIYLAEFDGPRTRTVLIIPIST